MQIVTFVNMLSCTLMYKFSRTLLNFHTKYLTRYSFYFYYQNNILYNNDYTARTHLSYGFQSIVMTVNKRILGIKWDKNVFLLTFLGFFMLLLTYYPETKSENLFSSMNY